MPGPTAIGLGATWEINDGGAGAFVDVDGILDLVPPNEVLGKVESKTLDIAAGVVTAKPTVFTPGSFQCTWEFGKTQFARLETLRTAKTISNHKFTLPEGSPSWTRTVPGFISSNAIQGVTADGVMTCVTTVEVTGAAS